MKLIAPAGTSAPASTIGAVGGPHVWVINGVAYTDNEAVIAYARHAGYTVSAGTATAAYNTAVAQLDSMPSQMVGGALRDTAEPARQSWPAGSGSPVDVAAIVSGVN